MGRDSVQIVRALVTPACKAWRAADTPALSLPPLRARHASRARTTTPPDLAERTLLVKSATESTRTAHTRVPSASFKHRGGTVTGQVTASSRLAGDGSAGLRACREGARAWTPGRRRVTVGAQRRARRLGAACPQAGRCNDERGASSPTCASATAQSCAGSIRPRKSSACGGDRRQQVWSGYARASQAPWMQAGAAADVAGCSDGTGVTPA